MRNGTLWYKINMSSYTEDINLVICATCGITFGLPAAFMNVRKRTCDGFYCPNGHSNIFSKAARPCNECGTRDKKIKTLEDDIGRLAAKLERAEVPSKASKT